MPETAGEVLAMVRDQDIKMIDLKFVDMPGTWQHLTVYRDQIDESSFVDGVPFDGSSIRGWKAINESDMAMVPDPKTAWIDPFMQEPTLSMVCTIQEPRTGELYGRCPRAIAQKAIGYLESLGIGDTAYFGPEAEFFVFDDVRFGQDEHSCFYYVDSVEGRWNTGREEAGGNLGYKPRYKEGYFPVAPTDTLQDMRTEMLLTMMACGVPIEKHHHEVATAGQCELGFQFGELITAADHLMTYKYCIKNVAKRHGKSVTFMPKPLFNDNGSGMHTHQSASIRIPLTGSNPKAKRLEFRCPDATCNPYLAFSAMLLAGLDGIRNEIDPGDSLDVDIYDLSPEELAKIPSTPGSLLEALTALEADHEFLTAGDVFTEDFITNWIEYKLDNEVNPLRLRTHPYELALYYDV